ncbi:hypothetical protein FB563_6670 [Streptomyces puniciscabiei]|uniref:Uncharacterized protein n=1 Tax=Streptomyces puniciscabiei TaxID=164348 RepID=A0A542TIH6_9ACTN|nr:hypothetical protein [Streptomyces puniciscabiei]TQK86527.1 hypothetical protein FB563_6670 [Streptomyces puniciscabiei]
MSQIPPHGGMNASYTSAQIRRNRLIFLGLVLVLAGMVAFWALGPYDTKDQSATLKAGDCFQNIGTDKEAETKKLDCTDPHADYKVLKGQGRSRRHLGMLRRPGHDRLAHPGGPRKVVRRLLQGQRREGPLNHTSVRRKSR